MKISVNISKEPKKKNWKVGDDPGLDCYEKNWTYLPAGSSCTFTQE